MIARISRLLLILNFICIGSINVYAGVPVNQGFADIVKKATPAVVNVSTTQKIEPEDLQDLPGFPREFFKEFPFKLMPERNEKALSLGSGFIIDPKGYIITSYHVIKNADEIEITLGNKIDNEEYKTYTAKVIGVDPKTDLALLKIDSKQPLPYLTFGDSKTAEVGDIVLAIGTPFGFGGTVTSGIISAKSRYIAGGYDEFLQTDASINKGNSGGPMLNIRGEVIGINSVIVSPSGGSIGIGFAIPSSLIKPVVKQLMEKGKVTRGWLGVKIQLVDENIAKALDMDKKHGAIVAQVIKGSPADKAGIKVGDVVVEYDGKKITSMNMLPRMVGETPINQKVKVGVLRNGKKMYLDIVIEKPEGDPFGEKAIEAQKAGVESLGITVQTLDDSLRRYYGINDKVTGVLVTGVKQSSTGAFAGVRPGDVIIEMNRSKINTAQDLCKLVKNVKKGDSILLLISRKGDTYFRAIKKEEK